MPICDHGRERVAGERLAGRDFLGEIVLERLSEKDCSRERFPILFFALQPLSIFLIPDLLLSFFPVRKKMRLTDGPMDGPTDRRLDQQMNRPSYRDAWTHLKTWVRETRVLKFVHRKLVQLKLSLFLRHVLCALLLFRWTCGSCSICTLLLYR